MTRLLLIAIVALLAACSSTCPYEGKDHPFRVAMRDMKPHYKTLEKFEADATLLPEALKAAAELKTLFIKSSAMKPAFLKADQWGAYDGYFKEMISAIDDHTGSLNNGQIKKGQALYSSLAKIKKAAHTKFIKQAKKHRGVES